MGGRILGVVSVAGVLAVSLIGCSGRDGPPKFDGPPVRVVCTTTIVADVVQRVGGERVKIESLMGPGVDPHKYLSGANDRKKLDEAHLVFFNGLHLEGKMADLFEKNERRVAHLSPSPTASTRKTPSVPTWTAANTTRTSGSTCSSGRARSGEVKQALIELDPAGAETTSETPRPTRRSSTSSTRRSARFSKRCRRRSACWLPPTTPSGTSAGPTASR